MMRQSLLDGFHETRTNEKEKYFDREVDEKKRTKKCKHPFSKTNLDRFSMLGSSLSSLSPFILPSYFSYCSFHVVPCLYFLIWASILSFAK
jgi:hypothetical protein